MVGQLEDCSDRQREGLLSVVYFVSFSKEEFLLARGLTYSITLGMAWSRSLRQLVTLSLSQETQKDEYVVLSLNFLFIFDLESQPRRLGCPHSGWVSSPQLNLSGNNLRGVFP